MTTTHTHTIIEFANPFMRCEVCHNKVTGYIDPLQQVQACTHRGELIPCRHNTGVNSVCPSWSPVDGCRCVQFFGKLYHEEKFFGQPHGELVVEQTPKED